MQATLIEIAARDPQHLKKMMRREGDRVTVTFHRQERAAGPWEPEQITVSASLPVAATGDPLYNAGAEWARLLQKAFAVFAERHGQYGVAYAPKGSVRPGYAGIVSGVPERLYEVFYGSSVTGHSSSEMGYDPERSEDLGVSVSAVEKLRRFPDQPRGSQTFLTASADITGHVSRTLAHVRRARREKEQPSLIKFEDALERAQKELQGAEAGTAATLTSVKAVKEHARRMVAAPATSEPTADSRALRELCLDLSNIGRDSSDAARFIYSGHGYAVIDVSLKAKDEAVVPEPMTQEGLSSLDFSASKVTLRNPHRTNVPTEGATASGSEGEFTITLAQFFRNFTTLSEGVVAKE